MQPVNVRPKPALSTTINRTMSTYSEQTSDSSVATGRTGSKAQPYRPGRARGGLSRSNQMPPASGDDNATGIISTIDGHTNSTNNHLTEINSTKIRQQQRAAAAAAQAKTRAKKAFCTVPLTGVISVQILLVIVAFVCIIVLADVTTNKTATELIEDSIRSSLKFAGTEISGPITAVEQLLVEHRERYLAYVSIQNGTSPCNEHDASFSGSAQYYSDTGLAMRANPSIDIFTYAKRMIPTTTAYITSTTTIGSDTPFIGLRRDLAFCSASRASISKFLHNATTSVYNSQESTAVPTIEQYGSLESLERVSPATAASYVSHHENQIAPLLSTTQFTWLPYLGNALPTYNNVTRTFTTVSTQKMFLLGVAPISFTVTTMGVGGASGIQRTVFYNFLEREAGTFAILKDNVNRIDIISSLGVRYNMESYSSLMHGITPAHVASHTSLYILDGAQYQQSQRVMLATSALGDDAQFDVAGKELYLAGKAPIPALNEAYTRCSFAGKTAGVAYIDMGSGVGGTITSCYIFEAPTSQMQLGVVQATPREHYFSAVTQLRIVMITVGVICALVVIVLCLFVATSIRNGILELLDNMALAAAMKNDETTYIISLLAEIEQLAKGFGRMNKKLLDARAYMPQHLLVTSDDSEEEEDGDEEGTLHGTAADGNSISYDATRSGNGGGNVSKAHANRRNNKKAQNATSSDGVGPQKGKGGMGGIGGAPGILHKRVTILSINVRGFHSSVNVGAPATIVNPISALTDLADDLAHSHKGVIDSFHGDHFVISFNAAKVNAEGPAKAARCALDLAAASYGMGNMLSMGISTGKASVGNLGSATLKRLSIVGNVYSRAMVLEKLCRRFNPSQQQFEDHLAAKQIAEGRINNNNSNNKYFRGGGPAKNVYEANDAISSSASSLLFTQCVIDAAMYQEIQYSFLLQVLGGVCGGPFATPKLPTAATGGGNNNDKTPTNTTVYVVGGGDDTDGDNLSGPNSPTSAAAGAAPAAAAAGPEFLYALRMQLNTGAADEWLYEMQSSRSGAMVELNKAMAKYIKRSFSNQQESSLRELRVALRNSFAPAPPLAADAPLAHVNVLSSDVEKTTTTNNPNAVEALGDFSPSIMLDDNSAGGGAICGGSNVSASPDMALDPLSLGLLNPIGLSNAAPDELIFKDALRYAMLVANGGKPCGDVAYTVSGDLPAAVFTM